MLTSILKSSKSVIMFSLDQYNAQIYTPILSKGLKEVNNAGRTSDDSSVLNMLCLNVIQFSY